MKMFRAIVSLLLLMVFPIITKGQGNIIDFRGGCSASFTYTDNGSWLQFEASPVDTNWYYTWDFGDGQNGSGSTSFNYYTSSGTYNVCVTVTDTVNTCSSTFCDSVTVTIPVCNSTYTYTTDSSGTYTFEASPIVAGFEYFWDFGDGSSFGQGDSVSNTYQMGGTYTVCLYTNDSTTGCNSSYCDTLDIFAPVTCDANFFTIPVNQSATFVVQGMNPALTYTFDFGDSTTGAPNTFGFVTHNYATGGTYIVCLNVVDSATGCTSSFCDTVTLTSCMVSGDFVITNNPNGQVFLDALQTGFQYQFTWLIMPTPDDTLITGFGRDTLTYNFTTNGMKSICLRVGDILNPACADSICKIVNISGIGIEEYNMLNNTLTVYPNPAKEKLSIGFTLKERAEVSYSITDVTGKQVMISEGKTFSSGQHSLNADVAELASGAYMIHLKAGDIMVNRKFIKN